MEFVGYLGGRRTGNVQSPQQVSRDQIVRVREGKVIAFDPAGVTKDRFGLEGIRQRARLLRDRAVINSVPGKGIRISVDLPAVAALEEVANA